MRPSRTTRFLAPPAILAALLACAGFCPLRAAGAGESPDEPAPEEVETSELSVVVNSLRRREAALEKKIEALEETVATLSNSLAVANSEAEVFRRQYTQIRLRMEALGLDALGGDKAKLEQRLLQAVNDLRIERERADQLESRLIAMSEAILSFMASAQGADPELRLALEEQLRLSAALIAEFEPNPAGAAAMQGSLTDSRVLSIKKEWSLLVANIGARQGVKVGMPFEVYRDGRPLGSVLAVDVRDRIFGGVVQTAAALDQIRVGDQMRVATR